MNKNVYRLILGYVAVIGSAIHLGNIISPGLVMWGLLVPSWVSAIVLFFLLLLGYLVFADKNNER